VIKPFQAL